MQEEFFRFLGTKRVEREQKRKHVLDFLKQSKQEVSGKPSISEMERHLHSEFFREVSSLVMEVYQPALKLCGSFRS